MEWLGPAVANIIAPGNVLGLTLAVAGGILVGALPGLTGTMAIALMVPFTYPLSPEAALIILGGIYVGAMYGGSISAILINTPGAPAAIATTFDGYPMATQGRAEEALCAAATGSGVGGLLGTVVLLFFAPALAVVSLKFGPPEYFWLGILGLTIIASLSARNIYKGLLGGLFGVLLSTIGLSPTTGEARLTFDTTDLLGGVEVIVALIGLFCVPQVLIMAREARRQEGLVLFTPERGRTRRTFFLVLRHWGNLVRSSIIGVIVGIIPGAGGNVAGLLSYQETVRAANDKESFGKGNIDGVIASETANNAAVEGSLVPLLTLGIPGAPQAAVLYGALLLHGLRPGAELFTGHGAVVTYTFILSLFLANLIMFGIGISASRFYARALNLPANLLMPVVLALSVVGAFAGRNSPFDVAIMMALGLVAYGGLKVGLAAAPIALGVILGPIMERGLVESMMLARATGGLLELLFTRPLSLVLIAMTVVSVGWPLIAKAWNRMRGRQPLSPGKPVAESAPTDGLGRVAADVWLGVPGLAIAAVVGHQLIDVEYQTAVVPGVTAALIAVLSLGFLARAGARRLRGPIAVSGRKTGSDGGHALAAMAIAVAYVALVPLAGFFVTTFVVVLALGWILAAPEKRRRQAPRIALTAVLVCAAFYGIFAAIFNVPFPRGLLF
ncbi:MAG: tripartite tricarboxylate transporter permease [Rhodospirillales bacterium]|jgi:putative tricarboxylic transport membrane protein|nr:tripartite tricarboxylate transporter permease [Rhodospirillales bacterium]